MCGHREAATCAPGRGAAGAASSAAPDPGLQPAERGDARLVNAPSAGLAVVAPQTSKGHSQVWTPSSDRGRGRLAALPGALACALRPASSGHSGPRG